MSGGNDDVSAAVIMVVLKVLVGDIKSFRLMICMKILSMIFTFTLITTNN